MLVKYSNDVFIFIFIFIKSGTAEAAPGWQGGEAFTKPPAGASDQVHASPT